jgi:hypothetical protein
MNHLEKYEIYEGKYTNDNLFVRWGGVNIINQKRGHGDWEGYKPEPETFHAPPAARGFYAFPLKAIEPFLAGHRIGKDKQRKFTYNGDIWHHLIDYTKPEYILSIKGSWVLSPFEGWKKAYHKQSLNDRLPPKDEFGGDFPINSINEPGRSGISGYYSKDHYEVFIPNKK